MKNSWFKTVNDHYQNAISILTGKPTSSQLASPDDDHDNRRRRHHHHHPPSHSHLNASRSALLWAAMPSSTLPTSRYLTRRVTSFIDNHDSSERDPIAVCENIYTTPAAFSLHTHLQLHNNIILLWFYPFCTPRLTLSLSWTVMKTQVSLLHGPAQLDSPQTRCMLSYYYYIPCLPASDSSPGSY